jgi:prevent-host-death family protein
MATFTIHEAKTNLSRLIEKACRGEEIVIARGSDPVVRLAPLKDSRGARKPGSLRGQFKLGPEFFADLPADELDRWE